MYLFCRFKKKITKTIHPLIIQMILLERAVCLKGQEIRCILHGTHVHREERTH